MPSKKDRPAGSHIQPASRQRRLYLRFTGFIRHNYRLMEFLDREHDFYEKLSRNGSGTVELPVEALEKAIKELELDEDLVKTLKREIEASEDFVTCYRY